MKTETYIVGHYIDNEFIRDGIHDDLESAKTHQQRVYKETHGVSDVEIRNAQTQEIVVVQKVDEKFQYHVDITDTSEIVNAINLNFDIIRSTIVTEPTEELMKELDERHRKICTGEWIGPETPYVKVIKELYKNKDWTKKD